MNDHVNVIVIGAGALGASTAWHLRQHGLDVLLVDRGQPGGDTSSRAAGLATQIPADDVLAAITDRAVAKLTSFEQETGQSLLVHRAGSIKLARTESARRQLEAEIRQAESWGVEVHRISPRDASQLAPWFSPSDDAEMWFAPGDLYLEPGDLPRAYTTALVASGGRTAFGTTVIEITADHGVATGIRTPQANIGADQIVLAAGAWNQVLAASLGVTLPLWPTRHQLCVTDPDPRIDNRQPAVRAIDARTYARPYNGGLLFGAYEPDPLGLDLRTQPTDFVVADLPLNERPLRAIAASLAAELPLLQSLPWTLLRGGLPTMTPDGHYLLDRLPGTDGTWVIGGCNVAGLATSPALGEHLADWIATGEKHAAVAPFSLDRFGSLDRAPEDLRRACLSTYAHKYSESEVPQVAVSGPPRDSNRKPRSHDGSKYPT